MARRFVRGWFSGELEEIFDNPSEDFARSNAESHARSVAAGRAWKSESDKHGAAYNKPWKSEALGIPLNQMKDFNEASKRAGTGARYEPSKDGKFAVCVCESRSSRAREMRLRGVYDKNAGLSGDYQGAF